MKWMSLVLLLTSTICFMSCEAPPPERKKDKVDKLNDNGAPSDDKNPPQGIHHADSADSANAYMHKRSVEELIQRFESEERDAYQKPQKVLDYLGDLKGKRVIDIGAGSGYFSVRLARRGAQVIAADVNEEFQAYVNLRRVEENLEDQIETRLIPYDSPGLDPQEVHMALVVNTYHHIKNRVDYFSQVKTGLKKEGTLVVIDFFKVPSSAGPPVDHKISLDVVVDELKKAGYNDITAEVDLLPHQYIILAQ